MERIERYFCFFIISLLYLLATAGMSYGAISLTVSPASAPAKTAGINFDTQASAAGGMVKFDVYIDSNNNGIIDGSEWAIISKVMTDNLQGDSDDILTGDLNPTSQNIQAFLNINYGIFPSGVYSVRVQNSLGETANDQFTLAPVTEAQTVTGKVYELGTIIPIPEAVVYCVDPVTEAFISAGFSDSSGNYTLQIPAPGDISIGTFKTGCIELDKNNITVTSGGVSSHSLYIMKSTAQITGTITEYGTGYPIWGAEVESDTIDDKGSDSFTDFNGNYTLSSLAGVEWVVEAGEVPGYFGFSVPANNYNEDIHIVPTIPGPNIVNFIAHKETAWIEGTLLDEYGNLPVEGALFFANRANTSDPALRYLSDGHYTNTTGQVTLGLNAGDWWVGYCMNCHDHPTLVGGIQKEIVPPSNVSVTNLTNGEHRQVTLNAYYADGAIEGRVFRQDGITPAPEYVRISAWSSNPLNGPGQSSVGFINTQARTDENGYYRIPLLGGTWTIKAEMWDWNKQSPEVNVTLTTDGNDVIDKPGETIRGIDLVLNLPIFFSITRAYSFTETFANHPGGRQDGWYLHLRADVYDPSGVPNNIQTVNAVNLDTNIDPATHNLNYTSGSTYKLHPGYNNQSGTYRFTAINYQGSTTALDAAPIDNPVQLPVIQNLAVSDNSTTPAFTFNPVAGADEYRLSIFDASLTKIYQSSAFNSPSFNVPSGVMTSGNLYYLRAEALDINTSGGDGINDLENRSLNYLPFTPNIQNQVTGMRTLPAYAAADADINECIVMNIDESNVPNGLIINENIPGGWTPNSCSPNYNSFDPASGKMNWVFFGSGVADQSICCNIHVPATEPVGAVRTFNGELRYNDSTGSPVTVPITGNQNVTIGYPFSLYDTDQDWIIGDFELLNAIDEWALGNLGDFELLDLIDYWAYGSYCWDTAAGKHKAGTPDRTGACQ